MPLRARQLQTFATLKQLAKLYRCAQGYNQGLYPHVWYIIFHDFLSLLQWWWSCSWLPPPHPHPTRQPPNTNNFFTPMYDTSFFMIFWAGHNGASLVHDLHDFSWPFCMILHDFAFFWRHTPTYHTSFSLIFWASHNSAGLVHGLHDFAWPYFMILHAFAFMGWYTHTYHTSFFIVFCHNGDW